MALLSSRKVRWLLFHSKTKPSFLVLVCFETAIRVDSDWQLNLLASALKTRAKPMFGDIVRPFQGIKAVNFHASDSGAAIGRRALCS